jgi:hypothetical protein
MIAQCKFMSVHPNFNFRNCFIDIICNYYLHLKIKPIGFNFISHPYDKTDLLWETQLPITTEGLGQISAKNFSCHFTLLRDVSGLGCSMQCSVVTFSRLANENYWFKTRCKVNLATIVEFASVPRDPTEAEKQTNTADRPHTHPM